MIFHVYGDDNCTYCNQTKNLLKDSNQIFFYHDIRQDEFAMRYVKEELASRTIPQIVSENRGVFDHVGGYKELVDYLAAESIFNT
jgi:glutaredoxin